MRYRTIVADPPWAYAGGFATGAGAWGRSAGADGAAYKSRALPYPSMTLNEIKALPISELADPSGCNLFLWTTNRYLRAAYDVLDSWGFAFSQIAVWAKPPGSQPLAPRYGLAPTSAEFLLFARRNGGCRLGDPWASSVITVARAGAHSQKPDVFLDLIESISPAPRVELFARRQRIDWDTWGNEALEHVQVAPRSAT